MIWKFISWRHDYNPKIDLYGNSFEHPWGNNYEQAIRDDIDYVLRATISTRKHTTIRSSANDTKIYLI